MSFAIRNDGLGARRVDGPEDLLPGEYFSAEMPTDTSAKDRAIAWGSIKAERDRRTVAGFNVGGKWVHSDTFSRSQWLGLKDNARDALTAGGGMGDTLTDRQGEPIAWKLLDGTFALVTAQMAFDVVAAVTCSDMDIFKVAEQHNAAMLTSANPAAYDYSTNWPQTYEEWAASQEIEQ
ncbi:DUF4376 domain-containing protein [Pseudomonas sp. SWRI74]|uniref:DUF4376 domain-containing protein n=1 Tax=Pseudomonas azerbaijanoccidentalis TaxID=2842347 RepID=A0ABS6QZS0_9PSED|nr:DUF4376 domain-containing protein [Pseudomonas azerbaijanoccidentalis]MBV4524384.1 DUF4376 domain-containing protein [Pseudomonas azerbaijanoccidentalis]